MKAHIKTYGCQMNEQDSLQMKGLLSQIGYDDTPDPYEANLILLVTCSIREKAVHKVYSELGRVRQVLEQNPQLIVGLAGCVAQQEKGQLFKRFPFLDMVFGPDAIKNLPTMVAQAQKNKTLGQSSRILETEFNPRKDFEFVNLIVSGEDNRVKAFVNIQKGCDNICSFCIVPRVRGREVSRPSHEIIDEIKKLVDLGVQEVTLLGQNVNAYGLKDPGDINFVQLLEKIATQTQIKRLRFTSPHPKDVKEDLIAAYRDLDILCPHLHLPVQSGSDKILQMMKRQYTRQDYLTLIDKLRAAKPGMAFTTDIIVGFPGETTSDFEDTLSLMDQAQFDLSFSFSYSARPTTTAAQLTDQLTDQEKALRLDVLQTRQRQISSKINEALLDQTLEVLVEGPQDFGLGWVGRSATNKIVHLTSKDLPLTTDLTGQLVSVRITKTHPHSLIGEVVHGFQAQNLRTHQGQGDRAYN